MLLPTPEPVALALVEDQACIMRAAERGQHLGALRPGLRLEILLEVRCHLPLKPIEPGFVVQRRLCALNPKGCKAAQTAIDEAIQIEPALLRPCRRVIAEAADLCRSKAEA